MTLVNTMERGGGWILFCLVICFLPYGSSQQQGVPMMMIGAGQQPVQSIPYGYQQGYYGPQPIYQQPPVYQQPQPSYQDYQRMQPTSQPQQQQQIPPPITQSPPQSYTPVYNPPPYVAPVYSPPPYSPPQYSPPPYSPPPYSPPQYSPPPYSPPQYSPPPYSPPQYNPPQYSPPQYSPPQYTPAQYSPPQYSPPVYTSPSYVPPPSYSYSPSYQQTPQYYTSTTPGEPTTTTTPIPTIQKQDSIGAQLSGSISVQNNAGQQQQPGQQQQSDVIGFPVPATGQDQINQQQVRDSTNPGLMPQSTKQGQQSPQSYQKTIPPPPAPSQTPSPPPPGFQAQASIGAQASSTISVQRNPVSGQQQNSGVIGFPSPTGQDQINQQQVRDSTNPGLMPPQQGGVQQQQQQGPQLMNQAQYYQQTTPPPIPPQTPSPPPPGFQAQASIGGQLSSSVSVQRNPIPGQQQQSDVIGFPVPSSTGQDQMQQVRDTSNPALIPSQQGVGQQQSPGNINQDSQIFNAQLNGTASVNGTVNGTSATTIETRAISGNTAREKLNLIPKSTLFSLQVSFDNPPSLAALKSNVKYTPFQIWWIATKLLKTVRVRPDYVFMMPIPFQRGIPAVNMTQVLVSPSVKHEVRRALIEQSPGMLSSQLSVIMQRVRMSEPLCIKDILSSSDPSQILNLVNPRTMAANIELFIQTLLNMPETGKYGITSVRAKLLPKSLLSIWLQFANQSQLSAQDLLGQSPIGARYELELALFGLTCSDIQSLAPNDILPVLNRYRHELYNLRTFHDVDFPSEIRRCGLEKVLDYLTLKGVSGTGHVLENLSPPEIREVGGEVLTAIPTSALKSVNVDTQRLIMEEIGHLDTLRLLSFAQLDKLHWYADQIFIPSPSQPEVVQARSAPDDLPDVGKIEASSNTTASSNITTLSSNITTTSTPTVLSQNSTELNKDSTAAIPVKSGGNDTSSNTTSTRVRRDHHTNEDKLSLIGSLFCYSSNMMGAEMGADTMKEFLETKDSPGQKTCCMDKVGRSQWNKFLKSIYGTNVSDWNEFDMTAMGDLLISLTPDDFKEISLDRIANGILPLIAQSGFNTNIKLSGQTNKLSFARACALALNGTEGDEFLIAHKNYMKKLATASEWIINQTDITITPRITCDGLNLAGPAAIGYTVADIKTMKHEEMFDCVETIGSLDWSQDEKVQLLQLFQDTFQFRGPGLTFLVSIELGKLVSELSSNDVKDLDLTIPDNMDMLGLLGSQITNISVLQTVASKFTADNRLLFGTPTGFPRQNNLRMMITSLGNVICGMNENNVQSVFESDFTLFLETSPVLGTVEGCPPGILSILASHATRPTSYGQPDDWSTVDVRTIGVVIAGLRPDLLVRIPPESMEGLTVQAMKAFPVSSISVLTPQQLSKLAPDVAIVIDQSQAAAFSDEQMTSFKSAIAIEKNSFIHERETQPDDTKLAGFGTDPFEQSPELSSEILGRSIAGEGGSSGKTTEKPTTEVPVTETIQNGHADDEVVLLNKTTINPSTTTTVQPPHPEGEVSTIERPTRSSSSISLPSFILPILLFNILLIV